MEQCTSSSAGRGFRQTSNLDKQHNHYWNFVIIAWLQLTLRLQPQRCKHPQWNYRGCSFDRKGFSDCFRWAQTASFCKLPHPPPQVAHCQQTATLGSGSALCRQVTQALCEARSTPQQQVGLQEVMAGTAVLGCNHTTGCLNKSQREQSRNGRYSGAITGWVSAQGLRDKQVLAICRFIFKVPGDTMKWESAMLFSQFASNSSPNQERPLSSCQVVMHA